jgi:hypothetical protein
MWIMNFKPNKALPSVVRSLSAIALIAVRSGRAGRLAHQTDRAGGHLPDPAAGLTPWRA